MNRWSMLLVALLVVFAGFATACGGVTKTIKRGRHTGLRSLSDRSGGCGCSDEHSIEIPADDNRSVADRLEQILEV